MKNKEEMVLDYENFYLDEIESIEMVGENETIDITVDDTHMFFANDIYTHNSSISADVVSTDQIQGSIKRAQVGHIILSVAKTMEQKDKGLATMAILKSRVGGDGKIFENMTFRNDTMDFDTAESNLISELSFEENKVAFMEAKKNEKAEEMLKRVREARKINTEVTI